MVKWGVQLVASEPPRAPEYYNAGTLNVFVCVCVCVCNLNVSMKHRALSGWIVMKFLYSIFNSVASIQVSLKTHKILHQDRPV